jgi:hypothetical protein
VFQIPCTSYVQTLAAIAPGHMRQIILIVLIFSFSCNNAPVKNKLIGEWVETYSKTGLILDFKDSGKVIFGSVRLDSTKTLDYKFDIATGELSIKDFMIFRTMGIVKDLTQNRFTIVLPDSKRLHFNKIENIKPSVTKDELINSLKNTTWTLKGIDDSLRVDFDSDHWWDEKEADFHALSHYWQSTPSKSYEFWNVGTYNGKLFLLYSDHQTEKNVGQIREFSNDRIVLTEPTYMVSKATTLIKKKKLSDEQIKRLVNNLVSKKWTSSTVDTIFAEQSQIRRGQDKRLKLSEINSKYEFTFNSDASYSILVNGRDFQNGIWKVTDDGEFIVIDNDKDVNNWIQFTNKNSQLTLSKLQEIRVDDSIVKVYILTVRLV